MIQTMRIGGAVYSKVILGTSYFGTRQPEKDAFALLDRYYALGGRSVDTARCYGAWDGDLGAAERTVGRWLALRKPDDVTVITKGAHPEAGHMDIPRLDRESIFADAAASVEALGRVPELWFLHRDDVTRPVEEIAETLTALYERGYVKDVGASNWHTVRIEAYNTYAQSNGLRSFAASQIQWSLARTTPEAYGDPTLVCMDDGEYAWYKAHAFPVLAFSSQAKGFFSKAIAGGPEALSEKARARFATPENLEKLAWVREECARTGERPAQVVLRYLTDSEIPTCAIIGPSRMEQLEDSIGS